MCYNIRMEPQKKILIIDDEKNFLDIFLAKLESAGFVVELAGDGVSGIKRVREWKPDLVLLDMNMPGLSGADVITKLKEESGTKDIKVAFITAIGDPKNKERDASYAMAIGAVGYIQKTDDLNKIVEEIRSFL